MEKLQNEMEKVKRQCRGKGRRKRRRTKAMRTEEGGIDYRLDPFALFPPSSNNDTQANFGDSVHRNS